MPGVDHPVEGCPLHEDKGVEAQPGEVQRFDDLEVLTEIVFRLARPIVDQVDAHVLEALPEQGRYHLDRLLSGPQAAEEAPPFFRKGLHPDAEPVYAFLLEYGDLVLRQVGDGGLHGHLSIRGQIQFRAQCLQDLAEGLGR